MLLQPADGGIGKGSSAERKHGLVKSNLGMMLGMVCSWRRYLTSSPCRALAACRIVCASINTFLSVDLRVSIPGSADPFSDFAGKAGEKIPMQLLLASLLPVNWRYCIKMNSAFVYLYRISTINLTADGILWYLPTCGSMSHSCTYLNNRSDDWLGRDRKRRRRGTRKLSGKRTEPRRSSVEWRISTP